MGYIQRPASHPDAADVDFADDMLTPLDHFDCPDEVLSLERCLVETNALSAPTGE